MKKTMDELAAKGDYTGAAAAQKEIQVMEKQIKEKFAPKDDFAEATAAQAVAHEMKTHEEQLAAKKKTMDELAAKEDFMGADAVLKEIKAMEVQLMPFHPERLACGLVEQQLQLEEKLSAAKTIMNELALKLDFVGAAEAQAKAKELEKRLSELGSRVLTRSELIEEQIRSKTPIMSEVPSKNDFVGAARDADHVPGFAVVYVVFGWAARAIHGKCLMLLEILFWMTADMNNLTCLYLVISGHQK